MGDPVFKRKYEEEQRRPVIAELDNLIHTTRQILNAYLSGDQQYAHIEPKQMELVSSFIDSIAGKGGGELFVCVCNFSLVYCIEIMCVFLRSNSW